MQGCYFYDPYGRRNLLKDLISSLTYVRDDNFPIRDESFVRDDNFSFGMNLSFENDNLRFLDVVFAIILTIFIRYSSLVGDGSIVSLAFAIHLPLAFVPARYY